MDDERRYPPREAIGGLGGPLRGSPRGVRLRPARERRRTRSPLASARRARRCRSRPPRRDHHREDARPNRRRERRPSVGDRGEVGIGHGFRAGLGSGLAAFSALPIVARCAGFCAALGAKCGFLRERRACSSLPWPIRRLLPRRQAVAGAGLGPARLIRRTAPFGTPKRALRQFAGETRRRGGITRAKIAATSTVALSATRRSSPSQTASAVCGISADGDQPERGRGTHARTIARIRSVKSPSRSRMIDSTMARSRRWHSCTARSLNPTMRFNRSPRSFGITSASTRSSKA